jgi:L-amino acid N-acyltransferase
LIRSATDADIPAIAAIWNPVIRDTDFTFITVEKTLPELARMLRDKSSANLPFLVAEISGRVSGFATYGAFRAGPGYARTMEHSLMLAAPVRGRGTGRALFLALEDIARTQQVHSLVAAISASNTNAIGFHLTCGFTRVGLLPESGHKSGRWHDLVLTQKLL